MPGISFCLSPRLRALGALPGMLLGGFLLPPTAALSAQQLSPSEALTTFSSVLNAIRLNYADTTSYWYLVHSAIGGMLEALDPHSHYFLRSEWEQFQAIQRGELYGVGMRVEQVDGGSVVLAVAPAGPAARSGVLAGDRIVAVNDTSTAGMDPETIALRLAGPRGSRVELRLARGSVLEPDTVAVTVKRDSFPFPMVPLAGMVDSVTGYVALSEFGENSAAECAKGIRQLKDARRLILDLRGNPGGRIDAAASIAASFLPKGALLFRERGRKTEVNTEQLAPQDGEFRDLPLVVLVDRSTASAAEVVAAALQDHDRAVIVGHPTFGKALVLTGFPILPSGDVVLLAVARWEAPSGRVIQRPYRGLSRGQYLEGSDAVRPADSSARYLTDGGRLVRGESGITPDVTTNTVTSRPGWWTVAVDSGWTLAVADSVAHALPATSQALAAWRSDTAGWRRALLDPLLARVRARLGVSALVSDRAAAAITRGMAQRVVDVRWGTAARNAFYLATEPEIGEALRVFPRAAGLLKPSRN